MKPLIIKVVRVRYNAVAGLAWLGFWAFLAFFLGVTMQWWTWESNSAPYWWVASAVLITIARPFKTVTITDLKIPLDDNNRLR